MSPDDIQRTMQFLLAQQAQFAADFERLSGKTDRMAEALIGLTGIVGRVADNLDRHVTATQQRFQEVAAQLLDVGAHIKAVESHMDVVIDMFERHLREDHGRGPS